MADEDGLFASRRSALAETMDSSSIRMSTQLATSTYVYEPLESHDMIRVLDLLPGIGELKCTITQVSVNSGGYTALSYEWGPQDMLYQIMVLDDAGKAQGHIRVTTNLRNALCDLRDSHDVKNKRFWIDQITINQQDQTEKGHQVRSMTTIYKKAARVIVYLGPYDVDKESEQGALDLLEKLHSHYQPNFQHLPTRDAINKASRHNEILPVQALPEDISGDDSNW